MTSEDSALFGQNTPYVCLCDCSQQTELRQRNTPRLLYRIVRQEHSPINISIVSQTKQQRTIPYFRRDETAITNNGQIRTAQVQHSPGFASLLFRNLHSENPRQKSQSKLRKAFLVCRFISKAVSFSRLLKQKQTMLAQEVYL